MCILFVLLILHSFCVGDLIIQLESFCFYFGVWNIARTAYPKRARLLFALLIGVLNSKILVNPCTTGNNFCISFACRVSVATGTGFCISVVTYFTILFIDRIGIFLIIRRVCHQH